jgi:hypothetical protein
MDNLINFFKDHMIDISLLRHKKFHLAFQIMYLVNKIRIWFFSNNYTPIHYFKELFELNFDENNILSFDFINEQLYRKYAYILQSCYSIKLISISDFLLYMENENIHSFNTMICYDSKNIYVILTCNSDFLIINVYTLDIVLLDKNNFIKYIITIFNNSFYMGTAYVFKNNYISFN